MRFLWVTIALLTGLPGLSQDGQGIDTELTCSTCHTGTDWTTDVGQGFLHVSTGFELKGVHGEISCNHCHTGSTPKEQHDFGRISQECSSCHEDIHQDQWGDDCRRCHSSDSWALSTQQQNHDLTNFPLKGPHRSLGCESCHVGGPSQSSSLALDCYGCHSSEFQESRTPSHTTLALGKDCESCHLESALNWEPSIFDHSETQFPLLGSHNTETCTSCHTQSADAAPTQCEGCHLDDYNASATPAHATQGYPMDCEDCHDSFDWNSLFAHEQTGFILKGSHVETSCSGCHEGQHFDDTPKTCAGCHLDAWQTTESPPHEEADFDQTCDHCHTEVDWVPGLWDHDSDTDYPLTGAHVESSCTDCHTLVPWAEQSTTCYECHRDDYESSLEPNHISAGIPDNCEVCHSTTDWMSEEIDHSETQFPLEGIHADLECMACHSSGYDLPTTCDGCHVSEYAGTTNPDHEAIGIPIELCETCHTQNVWMPAIFSHETQAPACVTCHQVQYDATTTPPHTAAAFGTDCEGCHASAAWTPGTWLHAENTDFDVSGAHLGIPCQDCHTSSPYSSLDDACSSCHQSDYSATIDPDHEASGIPADLCETCHSQSSWKPAIFSHESQMVACVNCHAVQYNASTTPPHQDADFGTSCEACHTSGAWIPSQWLHNEQTEFSISGAHLDLACLDCHTTTPYSDLINTCTGCHQSNYDNTANPDHGEYGYSSTLCENCHDQSSWQPSIFEHSSTNLECSTCHMVQYTNALEPAHLALGYPTNCAPCHSTEQWNPSVFSHSLELTGFELDGAHSTLDCSNCHASWGATTEIRTCASATCHADNFEATSNPPHESMGIGDDCSVCHTTNAWTPSQFGHDEASTGFMIEGAHTSLSCQPCHTAWEILQQPRSCADGSCHLGDYQSTTDPNHQSSSFPYDCAFCHVQSSWTPTSFDHDGQYFPINSGNHRGEWSDCSQCHVNSTDFATFTCFGGGCHNITEMNNEHCEDDGCESCDGFTYPATGVTPEDCLTCHPNGDEDDCGGDLFFDLRLKKLTQPEMIDHNDTR